MTDFSFIVKWPSNHTRIYVEITVNYCSLLRACNMRARERVCVCEEWDRGICRRVSVSHMQCFDHNTKWQHYSPEAQFFFLRFALTIIIIIPNLFLRMIWTVNNSAHPCCNCQMYVRFYIAYKWGYRNCQSYCCQLTWMSDCKPNKQMFCI